jgi:O-antigen ligase
MNTSTEAGQSRKRRSLPPRFLPVWIALTVVVFAAGSSSIAWLASDAKPLRWPVLFVLAAAALVDVGVSRIGAYRPSRLHILVAVFLGLALLSSTWSIAPRLTIGRVVSFGFVLLAAIAIDAGCRGRPARARQILAGIVCGATAVGVLGFVLLPFERTTAAQPAGPDTPWRFKGLGENPNTVSMFLAVAVPLAIWFALSARGRARVGSIAALAVFAATIALSGSRGALLAALFGAAVVSLGPAKRGARVAVAAASVAVFLGCVGISQIPQPAGFSAAAAARIAQQQAAEAGGVGDGRGTRVIAPSVGSLSAELGRPGSTRRKLFATSGRLDAWGWALGQARKRPALGYGFGTEQNVFVDRLYAFEGGLPENSFVGIALQLGILGVILLVAIVFGLIFATVTSLRSLAEPNVRGLAAACAGAALGGLALTVGQSYLYSAGNVATITVWIAAMLASGAAATWRAGRSAA